MVAAGSNMPIRSTARSAPTGGDPKPRWATRGKQLKPTPTPPPVIPADPDGEPDGTSSVLRVCAGTMHPTGGHRAPDSDCRPAAGVHRGVQRGGAIGPWRLGRGSFEYPCASVFDGGRPPRRGPLTAVRARVGRRGGPGSRDAAHRTCAACLPAPTHPERRRGAAMAPMWPARAASARGRYDRLH